MNEVEMAMIIMVAVGSLSMVVLGVLLIAVGLDSNPIPIFLGVLSLLAGVFIMVSATAVIASYKGRCVETERIAGQHRCIRWEK